MSFKRKAVRSMLRVVKEEEPAFRETAALVGALLDLQIGIREIQVGFVPSPGATKHAISPVVIVRQGEKAFTYRLNNHELSGTQEVIDERWREWLDAVRAGDDEHLQKRIKEFYRASRFAEEAVRGRLRTALQQSGIEVPGWPLPHGHLGRSS